MSFVKRHPDLTVSILLLILLALFATFFVNFNIPPFEDAAMLMRYADHLAHGYGIVWNIGGHPVDGATDFLFMVSVAALMKIGVPLAACRCADSGLFSVGAPRSAGLSGSIVNFGNPIWAFAAFLGVVSGGWHRLDLCGRLFWDAVLCAFCGSHLGFGFAPDSKRESAPMAFPALCAFRFGHGSDSSRRSHPCRIDAHRDDRHERLARICKDDCHICRRVPDSGRCVFCVALELFWLPVTESVL